MRDETWHMRDPEIKCYLPGVPRATYMPFPFQIVQGTADYILIAYEFPTPPASSYRLEERRPRFVDGLVAGRWDGDTLVVDVTGFKTRPGSTAPAISIASDARRRAYTPVSP